MDMRQKFNLCNVISYSSVAPSGEFHVIYA